MLASQGNNYCFKSKDHLCLRAGKFHTAWELLPHPPNQLVPTVFLWVDFAELSKISCPFGPIRHKRRIAGRFVLLASLRFGRAALHPPTPSSVSSGKGTPPHPAWELPVEGAQPPVSQARTPPTCTLGQASDTARRDWLREPDLSLLLFSSSFSPPHSPHIFPLSYNVF